VNLSSLQLQSNHLTGSVPESLGDLILLEDLNLSSNNLKGRAPRAVNLVYSVVAANG
jgi:Leucine-rich repeat (LRR) protein